ncbi:MAG: hypothetical protein Q8865_02340 [Bacillota bacterium]|nr:hypothetical protein [Bacillota bacterium]
MKKGFTEQIAYGGIVAALSVAVLFLSAIIPSGQFGFAAAAGCALVLVILHSGKKTAFLVFIAVSVLSLLLIPGKDTALVYVAFFGPYTFIKNYIERLGNLLWEWVIKLAFFNADITILYFAAKFVFKMPDELGHTLALFFVIYNVTFVLYDIAFSRLISVISFKLKKFI